MTYYIYKITNKINNKFYIGKTSNIKYRWYKHKLIAKDELNKYRKSAIHYAIKKYGIINFTFEVIDQSNNEEDILEKEKYYINKFKTDKMILYNLTDGGEGVSGWVHSPQTIKKISQSNIGKRVGIKNPMYGKGHTIVGENNPFYGRTHSTETLNKMSTNRSGIKNPRSILTEENVKDIKNNINNLKVKELATMYGVNIQTIYRILNGIIWKHII